ncbi:MAG: NeuD/PglB/VioB family sugar acetyltransferase [Cyclobacteriaceae bacterium]|jgi:sugar O-acyltransferase (sialic acid O-acetyltransferase NeuD family)
MSKKIVIYGAGGFGQEVKGMIELLPSEYSFAGFHDDFIPINSLSGEYDDALIAIADTKTREKIITGWKTKSVLFRPFISHDIQLHPTVKIGKGSIICPGVKLTVFISVGQFVIINLNTTIGHHVVINDFCSIMPSVNLSGNVKLGKGVFVGTGATILQGITIGENAIIGAGAVITKDVPPNVTVMGVPGRIDTRYK